MANRDSPVTRFLKSVQCLGWLVDTSIEQVPPATGRCGASWWTHAQSKAGSERILLLVP